MLGASPLGMGSGSAIAVLEPAGVAMMIGQIAKVVGVSNDLRRVA